MQNLGKILSSIALIIIFLALLFLFLKVKNINILIKKRDFYMAIVLSISVLLITVSGFTSYAIFTRNVNGEDNITISVGSFVLYEDKVLNGAYPVLQDG